MSGTPIETTTSWQTLLSILATVTFLTVGIVGNPAFAGPAVDVAAVDGDPNTAVAGGAVEANDDVAAGIQRAFAPVARAGPPTPTAASAAVPPYDGGEDDPMSPLTDQDSTLARTLRGPLYLLTHDGSPMADTLRGTGSATADGTVMSIADVVASMSSDATGTVEGGAVDDGTDSGEGTTDGVGETTGDAIEDAINDSTDVVDDTIDTDDSPTNSTDTSTDTSL